MGRGAKIGKNRKTGRRAASERSAVERNAMVRAALKIRRAMKKAGVGQTELAHRVGVTQGCVSSWLKGNSAIGVGTLARIANALGMQLVVAMPSKRQS